MNNNQQPKEIAPLNWRDDVTVTLDMAQECYDTKSIITLFTELERDGYSGLGLGLIIDLVRRDATRTH